MDLQALKVELLRNIRGKRSQGQVSRRLGFSYNKVSRWENGTSNLPWPDFVRFSKACKINIDVVLRNYFFYEGDPGDHAAILRALFGTRQLSEVADTMEVSRNTIARWLSGEAVPDVEDMLRALERFTKQLFPMVAAFGPPEDFPSLKEALVTEAARHRRSFELPELEIIFAALQLDDYRATPRHDDAWFAARLGIALERLCECMDILRQTDSIFLEGNHYSIAKPGFYQHRRGGFELHQGLRTFWMEYGLKRWHAGSRPEDLLVHFVIPITDEFHKVLHAEYVSLFHDISKLVAEANDSPVMEMGALLIHAFNVEEGKD